MPKHAESIYRPVLKPGVARAMYLGRELHMWNTVRRSRANLMANPIFLESSPAFISAFLVGLAQIDANRRTLKVLLADALDAVEPS
jgi:hypothetical protein